MKKSVFSKLVITFVVIIAVSFIMVASFLSLWLDKYFLEQRKGQLITEAQYIGAYGIEYLYDRESMSPQKMTDLLTNISHYLSTEIWVTDNYGYVYASSNNTHNVMKSSTGTNKDSIIGYQILTKELEELRINHLIEKKGETANGIKAQIYTFEVPLVSNGSFKGAVIYHISIEEIKAPLKTVYEIIWFAAILAIIVSWIIIYYFSQKIIIKPLAEINYVAGKLSKGDIGKRVKINSNDEIGELGTSFNYMADSLEQVEKKRREFISNVSHEIRSPITSIKGFIGGILDGVIPKEKEMYYLSVAYEETQRLTRLVNDLLDLSAIESGQFRLRIEEVELNEIIRINVINFETKIKAKKLKVDVCLEGDKLYVAADKDRLVQVVINLLDNAIKYVEKNGNISIFTKIRGPKVFVTIFNDGPCIPDEDIKNIWDRFYKVDKARSSKISTGLGLPIVRSILSQLEEDIIVENKNPKGVAFTFTLKRV